MDCDLVLEQDLDNDDETTLPPTSNSSSPIPPPPPPFVDDEVLRKLDDINSKIDQMKFEETTRLKNEVRKILTCTLCLETAKQSLAFCSKCGTFIGCYECATNIQLDDDGETKCPLCRAKLTISCDLCDATQPLPFVASKIPGLMEWLM